MVKKYSQEFCIAAHGLFTGKPVEEITPPNGESLDWERELFEELAGLDAKKRLSAYHKKTATLEFKPDLDAAIFTAVSRGEIEYIGKGKEKNFKSANYIDILTRMGYRFRMCDLDDSVEINEQPISDALEAEIRTRARDIGISKLQYMRDAYVTEAAKNHYNPVVDYLTGLQWDGEDWITTLAGHFSDEYDIFPLLLRRWLIGAVARIFEETQNRMLVLDGRQGLGKSRFVSWLASPLKRNFYEGEINTDDKDFRLKLSNTWIWEVSELGSTIKRSDIEALKSFITMQRVQVRAPYQRNPINKPAITSFIGTVNNIGGVLNDVSGNRRFMATTILSIDFDYTVLDVNQVWAQAYAAYKTGESWNLAQHETAEVTRVNENFETENPVVDLFVKNFRIDPKNAEWFTPTLRLIETLRENGFSSHSATGAAMVVSTAAKKLEIKKGVRRNAAGVLERGYYGIAEKGGNFA